MKARSKGDLGKVASFMAAPLSHELREKYKLKTFGVRKGDTISVVRGDFLGVEGKVNKVDIERAKLYIDGITREKADGSSIFVPVHPSKVKITKISLDDKWRRNMLKRRGVKLEETKVAEKTLETPAKRKKAGSKKHKPRKKEEAES
ncbi:50S ribosomal protein L24 [Candidatus Bathyarchaeota archaeon RBG_16_48_13]|nr:50S ribosomal protein L24, large subunit ribosomal protein L24 [uncultured archaeon]OGD46335.1 MAG: 50S ribosomal protein L24 [Candidatus Bathyarchaeota archaeon RBG_16_48_13]